MQQTAVCFNSGEEKNIRYDSSKPKENSENITKVSKVHVCEGRVIHCNTLTSKITMPSLSICTLSELKSARKQPQCPTRGAKSPQLINDRTKHRLIFMKSLLISTTDCSECSTLRSP